MSWQLSGELLAMVILGSANSLIGPILEAAFFLAFRDVLSDFPEHWMLFFGPLLVARVLLVKDGIWGMLLRAAGVADRPAGRAQGRLSRGGRAHRRSRTGSEPMSEFLLEIDHLSKAFGALRATDDVTLAIRKGETHALIGPNGAGKTTLVGQLTGELKPDAGRISFDGRDITALSTARRAAGAARSFQITSIFDSFTAQGTWRSRCRPPSRTASASGGRPSGSRNCASRRAACSTTSGSLGWAIASPPRCRTASTASSNSAWRSQPAR